MDARTLNFPNTVLNCHYASAFGSIHLQKGCHTEAGIFLCSPGLSPAVTARSKFLGTSYELADDQIFLAPSISAWLPRQEAYMAALMYRHNCPFYLTENSEHFVPIMASQLENCRWSLKYSLLFTENKSSGPEAECCYLLPKFVSHLFCILHYFVYCSNQKNKNHKTTSQKYILKCKLAFL